MSHDPMEAQRRVDDALAREQARRHRDEKQKERDDDLAKRMGGPVLKDPSPSRRTEKFESQRTGGGVAGFVAAVMGIGFVIALMSNGQSPAPPQRMPVYEEQPIVVVPPDLKPEEAMSQVATVADAPASAASAANEVSTVLPSDAEATAVPASAVEAEPAASESAAPTDAAASGAQTHEQSLRLPLHQQQFKVN